YTRTTEPSASLYSNTWGPRINMSCWAPRQLPTINAVGVASPNVHGHAMINTATAAVNAGATPPPASSHTRSVSTDTEMTTGTNTADTRSARRWTLALPA